MCQKANPSDNSQTNTRGREVLPTNVKPLHYKLVLEPNFETFKFKGQEEIDLQVNEETDYVTLNSLDIEVHSAKIEAFEAKEINYDEEKQIVTFKFDDKLVAGKTAKLHIDFTGELNDKMAGFYRSSYIEDGKKKYLATTQFEATDCRRAFPSFDEPALKATFDISLVAQKDLVALSNMDVKSTTVLDSDKKLVAFNTTPLMSTYLVAFIVGDLKYIENNDYRVPIRVYSTPGSEHLGHYSADIAAKSLKFFDEKFDIPYPLPKCDLVAIHDFAAGAMENFGLITFRTLDVLIDPKSANIGIRKRVSEVVMHELAHQWFGNLVTMDFWDGLWLNEGFATWMSWYACNALFPEWKVWESYVSVTLQDALSLDALRSSHPIEVPVQRADEINQIFDSISYAKGSSVLKMIANWLGEDTFIKGIAKYLKVHKWGNTKTLDLWKALSDVSGKDVVSVMEVWTKKTGFPVIQVKEIGNNEIEISQKRFLATNDVKPEEDQVVFPVFLNVRASEGVDSSIVFRSKSDKIKLPTEDDFFKLNANQSGIYRVVYEPERWIKLGKAGLEGKLSVEDRTGLVADAGSLASSGYITTMDLLNLVKLWKDESNYVIWVQIFSRIKALKAAFLFESEAVNKALDNFVLELIEIKLKSVGWEIKSDDDDSTQELKSSLFAAAAESGHKEALDYAKKAFDSFVAGNKSAIHPNLKMSIFGSIAKHGKEKEYSQLLDIYQNSSEEEEKLTALRALGMFRDPEILDRLIGELLNTEFLKPQNIYVPLASLRSHKIGIEKLWHWLSREWDDIHKAFPSGLSMLGTIVMVSTTGFTTFEQKSEVQSFFEKKSTKGFDQALARSLDVITTKALWAKRDSEKVARWLRENGYSN
ncbi:Piso0_003752 [Millerozyma farinosa CBS 7064]|uniref:Aminopeptidase n=1 Tax=Pichia sorbitophila (strain ATCC MYA-4447 / BCRC 22081 / CBS 7064 / NBRC 10061 / NRRL Y-12695) TaxID=559304 RepID=G8Y6I1_PICSO|nr:Piso0_003752 [Millerozyma farinosa CBS 7064]CCE84211.1 Piso0_003752 [Millerozyma farinosa CBS 7064]